MLAAVIISLFAGVLTVCGLLPQVIIWGAMWDIGFVLIAAVYFDKKRTGGGSASIGLSWMALGSSLISLIHHGFLNEEQMTALMSLLGWSRLHDQQPHPLGSALSWRILYVPMMIEMTVAALFAIGIAMTLGACVRATVLWFRDRSILSRIRERLTDVIRS